MSNFSEPIASRKQKRFNQTISILVGLCLLLSVSNILFKGNQNANDSGLNELISLDDVLADKKLTVGYGGFPPYTIINLGEDKDEIPVRGYSVDLIKEIALLATPPIEIEWVKFDWETIKSDLASEKFELIADPVYLTVSRALDLGFSDPYAYFGIGAGIVKKGDDRFKTFEDLNDESITISLAKGWTTSEYAEQNLDKPIFRPISVGENAFTQLDEVILGRVDVALNDVPTVLQYAREHADQVDAIFVNSPPSSVPGGFVTHQNSEELLDFLNVGLKILSTNGTIERLSKEWGALHYNPKLVLEQSSGLK